MRLPQRKYLYISGGALVFVAVTTLFLLNFATNGSENIKSVSSLGEYEESKEDSSGGIPIDRENLNETPAIGKAIAVHACSPPWSTAGSVRARSYHFSFLNPLTGAVWGRFHNVTPAYILVGDRWKTDKALLVIKKYIRVFTPNAIILEIPSHPKVPDATMAQVSRIYAQHLLKGLLPGDTHLVTSDIDLFLMRIEPWKILEFDKYDILLTNSECCGKNYAVAHVSMKLKNWMKIFPLVGQKGFDESAEYHKDPMLFRDKLAKLILDYHGVSQINDKDRVGPAWGTDQDIIGDKMRTLPPNEYNVLKIPYDYKTWERIFQQEITNPDKILDLHNFSEFPCYSYKNIRRTFQCFFVVFERNNVLRKEMIKLAYEYHAEFITTLLSEGHEDLLNTDMEQPR